MKDNTQIVQADSPHFQQLVCIKCKLSGRLQVIVRINEQQSYCQDCLQQILQLQQKEIKNLEQRYIFYKQFESSLDQNQIITQSTQSQHQKQADKEIIQTLTQQLKQLDYHLGTIKQQCVHLKQKIISMESQEEKFWDAINRFDKRSVKLQQKALNAKFQKNQTKNQIDKICKTSVVHQFFSINIEDSIGYVYGLAMGRRTQTVQINWEEVNAGLGHLILALNFLSIKYGYEYQKSKIQKLKVLLVKFNQNRKNNIILQHILINNHKKYLDKLCKHYSINVLKYPNLLKIYKIFNILNK